MHVSIYTKATWHRTIHLGVVLLPCVTARNSACCVRGEPQFVFPPAGGAAGPRGEQPDEGSVPRRAGAVDPHDVPQGS